MHTPPFTRRDFFEAGLSLCLAACTPLATARPRDAGSTLALAVDARADMDPTGHLVSEKYDGARALWTGSALLFRSGLPVAAPAWFTAELPADTALDGELWLGRGRFENLSAAVRRARPDDAEWRQIRYMVFDMPQAAGSFAERSAEFAAWLSAANRRRPAPWLQRVQQTTIASPAALQTALADVVAGGGEGLVLQRADAPYRAGRSGAVLKLKPLHDADAVVLAQLPGRGKHAGRMGALRVRTSAGLEFLIGTGFSDAQRAQPPSPGTVVTFTHRGLTASGVPRFASFLRERSV